MARRWPFSASIRARRVLAIFTHASRHCETGFFNFFENTLHRAPVGQGLLPHARPGLLGLVFAGACQGTAWAGLCLIHHHHAAPPIKSPVKTTIFRFVGCSNKVAKKTRRNENTKDGHSPSPRTLDHHRALCLLAAVWHMAHGVSARTPRVVAVIRHGVTETSREIAAGAHGV